MELSDHLCCCLRNVLVLLCIIACVFGALRPRGVPLSRKVFYNPSQMFNCLDGSGTYPFHFVNDDYCDCTDGSDEPGTSACPNGMFYCYNLGHKSESIPSSRVNDGICDCCDTSDEYNSTADCFNTCKDLGENALHGALAYYTYFMQGHEIREKYIKVGKEKREEYKVQFESLKKKENFALGEKLRKQDIKEKCEDKENTYVVKEKEIKEAQEKKIATEKKRLLEQQQQEKVEAKQAFDELDINSDGKLCFNELKAFTRFDYDHDGIVSDEEAKFYMHKKEEITLQEFLSTGWKAMKPAFTIEQACSEVEHISIRGSCDIGDTVSVRNEESMDLSSSFSDELKDKDTVFKDAAMARKEFADAIKFLQDIQTEKWNIKGKLEADFGAEDEFLVLEKECYELADKRYLYRFCPFNKVVQLQRPSNLETLVGLWDGWSGPESNIYTQMKFTRGNICWNGPNRSAQVNIRCGVDNKLLSAEEFSPCAYLLEFSTPAACHHLPTDIQEILDRRNVVMV